MYKRPDCTACGNTTFFFGGKLHRLEPAFFWAGSCMASVLHLALPFSKTSTKYLFRDVVQQGTKKKWTKTLSRRRVGVGDARREIQGLRAREYR